MVLDLFLLASMAFATGFGAGWVLRWFADREPVCQSDNPVFDRYPPTMIIEPEEIVPLEWTGWFDVVKTREYLKDRGNRS